MNRYRALRIAAVTMLGTAWSICAPAADPKETQALLKELGKSKRALEEVQRALSSASARAQRIRPR